jgi:hypothetical protein
MGESFGACMALSVAARNPDLDIVLIISNPGMYGSLSHPAFVLADLWHVILSADGTSTHNTIFRLIVPNFERYCVATSFESNPLQPYIPLLQWAPDELYRNVPYLLSFTLGNFYILFKRKKCSV